MTSIPLVLGALEAKGFSIQRSGIHWLCPDGYVCRPNEVIGYCNISIEPQGGLRPVQPPFASERELQVAFAPRIAGRVHIAPDASLGGYLNALGVNPWDSEAIVGRLEPLGERKHRSADAGSLRLLMLAGRRMTGLADVPTGLLPGWHSRARGWWWEEGDELPTFLNLGICDASGPIRGDHSAFLELFEATSHSAHFVSVLTHPISPCAPCLVEQYTRTPTAHQAIANDIMRVLSDGSVKPNADDWLFVGALLSAMESSPMADHYDVLTSNGLRNQGPPSAVLLSLHAEGPSIMRHKMLGYHLHMLRVYEQTAGPAVRAWLASAFEPIKRTVSDIQRDFVKLIDTVAADTRARFLILNRMSTSGREDISAYAPFDQPMGDTLSNIASKELNLMLHDLADERDISIIDVDALAADLGGSDHLPDGIHQSGAMQAHVRAEILHTLGMTHI